MYADTISEAMQIAITETERRRKIQEEYNRVHNIIPKTIEKEIRDVVSNKLEVKENKKEKMSKKDRMDLIDRLTREMKEAAKNLDFEKATELRDAIFELESEM